MEPTLHGCKGCVGNRIMVDKTDLSFQSLANPVPGFRARQLERAISSPIPLGQRRDPVGSERPVLHRFRPLRTNDLVKRIIAVGGQTVECRADTGLTVDGKNLTSRIWIRPR